MSLTRIALEKDRITLAVLLCLLVAGLLAYGRMPRAEDPGFTIRTAVVITQYPGASPHRMELLVTDKIEKRIQEMPEVKDIRSDSSTGVSVISVDLEDEYANVRPIWDKLRRKVQDAQRELPEGVIGPFVNDEYGDVFGIIVSITGDGFSFRELEDIADTMREEVLLLPEVAKVDIYGAQEERIFVEYDNARLSELGLSPESLQSTLQAQNIIFPGGDISTGEERIALEPSGNFESVAELRRAVINIPDSDEYAYLGDIASVRRGYVDPAESLMHTSGIPSLGLAISMKEGGNIIRLGEMVKATVERARGEFPAGVEFDFIQFQPDAVQKKIDDFQVNLFQAVAIVAGVMLVTLGLRTGLVVASLVPTAMIGAFFVMSQFGIGLNQMSLAALIIALGLLVDNGIVMSESILVRAGRGEDLRSAAIASGDELKTPLLISSLTTAAAFLPIYLAEGNMGEYTAALFQVVTITLLVSWVVALTVIPLLCARFLKVEPAAEGHDALDSPFYHRYRAILIALLHHRKAAILGTIVLFFLAVQGLGFVPALFVPANDRPTFSAELELPIGSPIERTEAVVKEIEGFVQDELLVNDERSRGITNWASFIGNGGPRYILSYGPQETEPSYAYMLLNASDRPAVDELIPKIEKFALDNFPDLQPTIRPLELGAPSWPPVAVRIIGRDPTKVFEIVDEVKAKIAAIPGTRLITDDWGAQSKKIGVKIDEARALRAGVTNRDIALSLQSFLSGLDSTEYREDDKLIPVTLRSVAGDRDDIDRIESINVFSQQAGSYVPLGQVADLKVVWEPAKIKRRNRFQTVTVEAGVDPGTTATQVNEQLIPWLTEQSVHWPSGYSWELGGEAESSTEANEAIGEQLPTAGLLIILLLVGQFNSFRKAGIILLTIPLGLIGVVIGLLVMRSYFGFFTLLGLISLAGVVINNGIVLLDRIRIEIDSGRSPAEAVVRSAMERLRPILLTTATTVLGLIPLYLGGGPLWEPLAVAIMFGLLFATVLTLGFVPVLYSAFYRVDFSSMR